MNAILRNEGRTGLTALERAVVASAVYSDVFDYPVTPSEVRRGLSLAATEDEVVVALEEAVRDGLLCAIEPYYALAGRDGLAYVRRRREAASTQLMQKARTYGGLIARLPFVRMVAVTGSLAVDNAEAGDDIDYLIVTAPGRLWLTRTLVMLVVRLAAARGVTLCPNYIISESALALPQRDVYTARELVQMVPVAGRDTYDRMLAANDWRDEFLPNATPSTSPRSPSPYTERRTEGERSALDSTDRADSLSVSGLGERVLSGPLFDPVEGWLMRRKARELQAQAGASPETRFDESMCKGHMDGYQSRTAAAVARRLRELGVEII